MELVPNFSQHSEWMSLVPISGPFLSRPVLERVFPQGLDRIDTPLRQRVRRAYEEWRDVVDEDDLELEAIHEAWVRLVLEELLECEDQVLKTSENLSESLSCTMPEQGITLHPDLAIIEPNNAESKPHLLIMIQPPDCNLDTPMKIDHWPASPAERMTQLCRTTGVSLGLVTNGEHWMLVNAPMGSTSGYASWYARLWQQEPITIRAFQSLLGVRRFFGPEDETLEAMLEASLEHQEEVTDRLGEQVRRAVEVLIQALDRADIDRNRELLNDVKPTELYEAGLTVMMRLVFLLCAEERKLLLLGDPTYDQHYAVSTLRAQLHEDADRSGLEVLEYRQDSWSRLLSTFRAVYGGVGHESLHMPALGGSLFDPDRFPFLEGRSKGTSWRDTPAKPLPIDNRTVLLLLDALQVLEHRGGAQLLSYHALDIEQIGHVYEGLLEHTVARVPHTTLGLLGSQKAKNPNVGLVEMETAMENGRNAIIPLLQEATQRSESALRNALDKTVEDEAFDKLLLSSGGNHELAERIRPFAHLMRNDNWGYPLIYIDNAFAVTMGADRRETGTHYTPKSLTEPIVTATLEPLVYFGPAEGEFRENWKLRSSSELLDLKICDPAMGSGAFLVQVCRWLAERLVESWWQEEAEGKFVTVDGNVFDSSKDYELLPKDVEERLLIARNLVAERCLYGVDLNPLAVELTKLSVWLVTLSKGRPFGFLDHNLRCGNSLLGIKELEQLLYFEIESIKKGSSKKLFAQEIDKIVLDTIELRKDIRSRPIRDIHDVEVMNNLNSQARKKLELPELIADALVGEALKTDRKVNTTILSIEADGAMAGQDEKIQFLRQHARSCLSTDLLSGELPRKTFHWPLEFPEVFCKKNSGFDAILGNPPFLGGKRITGTLGKSYREYLVNRIANGKRGHADLCTYFLLRADKLLNKSGTFGMITTDTIAQGDTREVGLDFLVSSCHLFKANPSQKWPGTASVMISLIWGTHKNWEGDHFIGSIKTDGITAFLTTPEDIPGKPYVLSENSGSSFIGSQVHGKGFLLDEAEVNALTEKNTNNKNVLFPYLNGRDLNTQPDQSPTRFVINFFDFPLNKETAPTEYEGPVAADYPDVLLIVTNKVKPERDHYKRKAYREKWWRHAEPCMALYRAIENEERILVKALVSPTWAFSYAPGNWVFDQKIVVLIKPFSILQSSLHYVWALAFGSTMGATTLNYTPTDCVETFPLPRIISESLKNLGGEYYDFRSQLMQTRQEGLTKLYNRFHNPEEADEDILKFRDLQIQLDNMVALAYGFEKIDLAHGFHETKQGIRFTISNEARRQVLGQLLKLNLERYDEEKRQEALF
jgi:hypothetical protein